MPRVSVLIAAYDAAAVLERAVASALSQQEDGMGIGGGIEVIVADDASTDDTVALARSMADADPRIRVLEARENGGPGVARARALDAARGDWVAVLDADDTMAPGRLALMTARAAEAGLDFVADNLELHDPAAGPVGRAFPLVDGARVPLDAARVLANAVPGGRINLGWMQPLVRRDFLLRHGLAWRPLRHGEDMLFTLEVLLAGAKAELMGEALYRYTQRRGTVSGAVSEASRTRRSADEQIRALDALEAAAGPRLTWPLRQRLRAMRGEIRATASALDARDRLDERRWLAAGAAALGLARRPAAFARCVRARFGPDAKRIV